MAGQITTCEKFRILKNLPHNCRRNVDGTMYCLEVLDRDEIICASTLVPVQQVDINSGAGDPSPGLIEDEIYAAKIKYRATETAQKILKERPAK